MKNKSCFSYSLQQGLASNRASLWDLATLESSMHDLDTLRMHKAREVVKFMWSFFEQSASSSSYDIIDVCLLGFHALYISPCAQVDHNYDCFYFLYDIHLN
jgi:hypothetical protein